MERTVVMLSWEYPPHLVGGLARHVYALSRELARQGVKVHVVTRSAPHLPTRSVEEGVHVTRVAPIFQEPNDFKLWACHLNFALLEAGVSLIRELDEPVLIHAHDWLVAHAARGLKHLFRAPLVATMHATEHGRNRGIHDPGQQYINDVEWWLTYEAWRVIVCSESMRNEVRSLFGLADDKLAVIPNGVELEDAKAEEALPPRTAFAASGEKLLFHIGRLVPEKGAGVLLETMPYLLSRHNLRLVIAGSGPYRSELERRAVELGVANRVLFTGYIPDSMARTLYRYADVAVVPSTYEPFGIVALEAMANGTPVVVSDVGGLSSIVQHGLTGLKALPGNVHSLMEQIDHLLRDRPLAERLAGEALRLIQERYSWESVARSTREVYDSVMESHAHSEWALLNPVPPHTHQPSELPGRYAI